ncbi:MAG: glycosyltransferase [Dysgonamonadaceae bacterium]|jgi:glycosyltransferase involved in cell wall biosynthesis|nr:glycosyltransferase [Dysgonamonadaceae bacterium]
MLQSYNPHNITIITVVYNDKFNLEKTLLSVIGQSYENIEYIVIDGGSTDGSPDLIKKYAAHLASWISEKDAGIYNAMNKGIGMASGEWVCFLNSGDVFVDSEVVGKVVASIHPFPEKPDIVYGNILVQKPDGTLKEAVAKEPCNIHRMYFCHQSAFVRLPLLQKWNFDEKHPMSADLKFFKQCYYDKRIFRHLNFPVVIYDKSGISNTERICGLYDNIAVIRDTDKGFKKYLFLIRLYFVIFWRKLNGKK